VRAMVPVPERCAAAEVPVTEDRVLRLRLHRTGTGQPRALSMAIGWRESPPGDTKERQALVLPGYSLRALREALAALEEAE